MFQTRTMIKSLNNKPVIGLDLVALANILIIHDQSIPQIQYQSQKIANIAGFK